ncbi:major facilitator superfamily domain-containing protein [Dimargaris cristalligena]|uniref:Major facilitator superfamily domain-containing protein n=1 Tax=Dimargaris cristalligena TaxID=215637 RepID=A0A4P9ZQT4_9FUNG|nr:major facilitator superfamily domain-containing protein [Dimargaris cristalligena]|eukprot:RKP35002.1 major facilitator superfamily domain-containing protein [Dimargaris cristalligena]
MSLQVTVTGKSPSPSSNGAHTTWHDNRSQSTLDSVLSPVPYSTFSTVHKRFMVAIIAFTGIVAPFSSNVFLPALPDIANDMNTTVSTINAAISVFMAAMAIAPLLWGPLGDNFGRRWAFSCGSLICTAASVGCALSPNPSCLIAMRFFQAFGGSVLIAGGAGTICDIYEPAHRGQALGLYFGGQMTGPIFGTILGGYVGQALGWRSIFWMTTILSGISWLLLTFVLPETHRPSVVRKYRIDLQGLSCEEVLRNPPIFTWSLLNPFAVFGTLRRPYVVIPVVEMSLIMASFYSMNTIMTVLLKRDYGYTTATVGLCYIASGAGNVLGAILGGTMADYTLQRHLRKSTQLDTSLPNEKGNRPVEARLPFVLLCSIIFPLGILAYGWFMHFKTPIALALCSQFFVGFATNAIFSVFSTYLVDLFTTNSASITSMANMFRGLYTALWTGIIDSVSRSIGVGWTFTMLSLTCCVGAALGFLLYFKGGSWRQTHGHRA